MQKITITANASIIRVLASADLAKKSPNKVLMNIEGYGDQAVTVWANTVTAFSKDMKDGKAIRISFEPNAWIDGSDENGQPKLRTSFQATYIPSTSSGSGLVGTDDAPASAPTLVGAAD